MINGAARQAKQFADDLRSNACTSSVAVVSRSVTVGRSWNGRFGRLARRDIWLRRDDGPHGEPLRWTVEIRLGDADGEHADWTYDSEADALAMVRRCIDTGGDGWQELTTAH
jgi:hypothetical protein